MKKIIFILIILWGGTLLFPNPSLAACNFYQSMTTTVKSISSWSTTCTVSATEGIDDAGNNEASTTNVAVLTLVAGGSITINAGTLYVGSLVLNGGTIATLTGGGSIKIGSPLYIADADADGYATDFTLLTSTSSGRRRLGLMKSFSAVDCGADSYNATNVCCTADGGACSANGECCNSICRTDADSDGYYVSASTTGYCRAGTTTNDCNDSDSSYYPGNGGWYSDSGDHNCSGGVEYLYSDFSCSECDSGRGRQSDSDGIQGGTGCGSSGTWWVSLGWGCWTPSTTCPANTSGSVTQQCH